MAPQNHTENTDRLSRVPEDVHHFFDHTTVTAAVSLKELLRSGQVESALVNALSAGRTPPQVHAAVKQVMARVPVVKRPEVLPHLEEWKKLCLQLARWVMTVVD